MELERLNQRQFDRYRDFIYTKCGIRIDEKKVTLLSNRVRRRLKAGDFEDFDVYFQFLTSPAGAGELEAFVDAITTNETSFFRTAKHFEWFKTELISEWVAQQRAGKRSTSVNIWSAGCASGAEPYSMAISLAENAYRLQKWSLRILGTDISSEMLRAAREGVFKARAIESVSEKQRRQFFQFLAEKDLWQLRPKIKQLVEFKQHNLIHRPPAGPFDCIFLRNVLIYFDRDSKQVAINHLLNALAVGGYLVVGPSEGVYDMLAPLIKMSPFLYQKTDSLRPRRGARASGGASP